MKPVEERLAEEVRKYEHLYNPTEEYKDTQMVVNFLEGDIGERRCAGRLYGRCATYCSGVWKTHRNYKPKRVRRSNCMASRSYSCKSIIHP